MQSGKKATRRRRFAVRTSPIHNRGVFALRAIPKGTRLIEYKGERISHRESERRYASDDDEKRKHTFLFIVDDKVVVDATHGGNTARWINHSCDPNCEPEIENGRIFIDAIRAIRPGEELTYDYGLVCPERHTPALKRLYACRCGAKNCRGTMLGSKR